MGHVSSSEYWGLQIPQLVNYGKQGHLTVRSVKLVADGMQSIVIPDTLVNADLMSKVLLAHGVPPYWSLTPTNQRTMAFFSHPLNSCRRWSASSGKMVSKS